MTSYTLPTGFAYNQVSIADPAASSYTINTDSYLLVGGDPDTTALALSGGVWKVTINGGVSALADNSDGVFIDSPQSGTGNAKVTVGSEGSAYGTRNGIVSWGAADVSNSGVISGVWDGVAFDGFTGPSNLTALKKVSVDNKAGALISGSDGVDNYSPAAITIKNAGTIQTTGPIETDDGLHGGLAIYSKGLLTLTNSGLVSGDIVSDATGSATSGNSVTNTATIDGAVWLAHGKNTITNSGAINGSSQYLSWVDRYAWVSVFVDEGSSTIKNTGSLDGTIVGSPDGANVITNSGQIYGGSDYGYNSDTDEFFPVATDLGGGADSVTNSGQMYGSVWLGSGNDTLTNSSWIYNTYIDGGDGNDTVTNSGSIGGTVDGGDGNDTITNTGSIYGPVYLGAGTNTLKNSKLITDWVTGGDGGNTITNSGEIDGSIQLGNGNDTVTNSGSGIVYGAFWLGGGNDSFTGNNSVEYVHDEAGNDTYKLGGGNDFYYASNDGGNDIVDGGAGTDTFAVDEGTPDALKINLGTTVQLGLNAQTAAFGVSLGSEKVTGFEIVQGTSGNDTIIGSTAAETLYGNDGNDTIVGGGGADKLWGGAGDDLFELLSAKDSGVTRASTQTIMDFTQGEDTIDLSHIDGNSIVAGFQNFHDLIANDVFSGSAGELRYVFQGGQTMVQGDTNGDKKADFQIALQGNINLTAADFSGLTV